MKNFKYKNKEIEFKILSGEVIDTSKHSETHVSSSGGGGYVGQHGGHVSAPAVSSKTITKHEFWVRTDDGKEEEIQLSGVDISLRKSQKITLLYAALVGTNDGYCVAVINHTTGKNSPVTTVQELNKLLEIDIKHFGNTLVVAGAVWFGTEYLTGSVLLSSIVAVSFFCYRLFIHRQSVKMQISLNAHMEKILNDLS